MINGKSRIYMPTFGFMISFSPDFAFKIIKIIVIAALLATAAYQMIFGIWNIKQKKAY